MDDPSYIADYSVQDRTEQTYKPDLLLIDKAILLSYEILCTS